MASNKCEKSTGCALWLSLRLSLIWFECFLSGSDIWSLVFCNKDILFYWSIHNIIKWKRKDILTKMSKKTCRKPLKNDYVLFRVLNITLLNCMEIHSKTNGQYGASLKLLYWKCVCHLYLRDRNSEWILKTNGIIYFFQNVSEKTNLG